MAIIRFYQHSDIFMIVTINPRWSKIQNELLQGKQESDWLNLIAYTFEIKRHVIMEDIKKGVVLGHLIIYIYTIKF